MSTLVVAPAEMDADVLGGNVPGSVVDRLDVQLGAFAEILETLIESHLTRHRKVRAVDLKREPGRVNRVVLELHHVGESRDVLLVGRVVLVLQKHRDDARRRGAQERVLRTGVGHRGLEVRDVDAHRLEVAIGNGTDAGGHRKIQSAQHALHVTRVLQ
jgi:hypothetical protein